MSNTIEEQQRQRAEGKAAAISGLRGLIATMEADERSYAVLTCHGRAPDEYGIERDRWGLEIVWRGAAALYMAPQQAQIVAEQQAGKDGGA